MLSVWGQGTAIKLLLITFSTTGFGDYTPESELGRVLASFWIIFGVLSFGNLAGSSTKNPQGCPTIPCRLALLSLIVPGDVT